MIFHVVIGVLIAVLLNARGCGSRASIAPSFVLPIVIPTLVVANVWRNMFDPDFGAINQFLASMGGLIGISPATFHIRWIESVTPPIPGIPLPLAYFALIDYQHLAGLAFYDDCRNGRAAKHQQRFLRSRFD